MPPQPRAAKTTTATSMSSATESAAPTPSGASLSGVLVKKGFSPAVSSSPAWLAPLGVVNAVPVADETEAAVVAIADRDCGGLQTILLPMSPPPPGGGGGGASSSSRSPGHAVISRIHNFFSPAHIHPTPGPRSRSQLVTLT